MRAQAQQWMRELFAWDQSEKQYLSRLAVAKGLGFEPDRYVRPFPGTTIHVNETPRIVRRPLWPVLLFGLLLGAIAAGAGTWYVRKPELVPPAVPAAVVPAPITQPTGWQWQLELKAKDGTWQPLGEPVQLKPGG